jgi:ribosomal protein L17
MVDNPERHIPEYWLAKAKEARRVANGLATEANRKRMLAAAENFERLAAEAELEKGRVFTRSA